MKKNKFIIVADEAYFSHAYNLIKSIDIVYDNQYIEMFVVTNTYNSIITFNKNVECFKNYLTINPIYLSFIDNQKKPAFCANIRAQILYDLCKQSNTGDKLIYIDADSVILKKLLILDSKSYENMIFFRNNLEDIRYFVATGVILITVDKDIELFIKNWKELISPVIYEWYSDQIQFYNAYIKNKSISLFESLDIRYIDWNFKPSSFIWTAKGKKKDSLAYTIMIKSIYYRNIKYKFLRFIAIIIAPFENIYHNILDKIIRIKRAIE